MSEVLAGKIGVTNGGEWNAETYYEEATFVRHQNNLYLSNLPSTGVEPTNEEYWMLAMEGFSGEDVQTLIDSINNIINGTTQVGNAKTLDGHNAEYFFPKSGGEVTGDITQQTEGKRVMHNLKNDKRIVYQEIDANGNYNLFDGTNSKVVIRSTADGTTTFGGTASGNLPLTGGTLNDLLVIKAKNGSTALLLQSAKSDVSLLKFTGLNGVQFGFLGFEGAENPVVYGSNGQKVGTILHTGNKPTGTYTGNGDATERTIATGGIGRVAIVFSANGTAILTSSGANIVDSSGNVTFSRSAHFENGNITMKTDNNVLNSSGATLRYQVL